MTTSAQPQPGPISAADEPILCIRCEYNLHGLPRDGKCPECGEAIEPSWKRHEIARTLGYTPLHLTPSAFLRRMGWSCIIYASAAMADGIIAMTSLVPKHVEISWLLEIASIVLFVMMGWGQWRFGEREPRSSGPSRLQIMIRIGCLFWVIQVAESTLLRSSSRWLWTWERASLAAAAGVGTWAVWQQFSLFFRRSRRRGFARWASAMSWAWAALFAAQMIFGRLSLALRMHLNTPVLGDRILPFFLPYSLLRWPRFDRSVRIEVFIALLAVLTLATLLEVAQVCFIAARKGHIHEPSK